MFIRNKTFLKAILNRNLVVYNIARRIYKTLPENIKATLREAFLVDVNGNEVGNVDINEIKLNRQDEASAKDFSFPSRINNEKQLLNWQVEGGFDGSYSLNIVNREFAKALDRVGVDVGLYSTIREGDTGINKEFIRNNPDIKLLYEKGLEKKKKCKDVVSRGGYPPYIGEMNAQIKILHCYAWEESKFPLKWIKAFNRNLNAVSVASRYVKELLINNGLTVPCFVSGLGVDHLNNCVSERIQGLDAVEGKFKFLHVSSCFPRKGIRELLEAYFAEFSNKDNVVLIVKTFPNKHNNISKLVELCKNKYKSSPDLIVINNNLSSGQLKYLYAFCDVIVCPSKAEGFNLPLLEAMTCGKPAIATNWSGQTMFCRVSSNQLIDYRFETAKSHLNLGDSYWAQPNVTDLRHAMRKVIKGIKVKDGEIDNIKEKYSWENVARNVIGNLSVLKGLDIQIPKIAWMSTWNKKCGIATYSKNLIKYCPFENIILAPVDDSDITKDEECVARCWHQRRREDFENVITIIKEKEIRVLIIQWHPGIYYGMSFNRLLNELQANNVATILCMHSTSDEKAMGEIKKDLTKFDRVLVHTINDIERLKHYGVVDNVALLPHGVKEFDIPKDGTGFREINKDSLTIGTFGFCLPHKGLRELVQAMVIYRRNHSNTKLHGVFLNSTFPSIESDLYAKEIKQLIKRNELDINFDNNFYEESVIANKLSSVDMLMFPYQKTGESASGAVRYAIALKKPTVVTPLEIFDDVRECVEFASDITPESLAASIEDVYNNIVQDCENSMNLNKKQSKWLEEHSYKNISMNLFQMSYALYQDRILKMNGLIDFDDL